MLNLFQHLFGFRRLRVMPAMTGTLQTGFLEVPLSFPPSIYSCNNVMVFF